MNTVFIVPHYRSEPDGLEIWHPALFQVSSGKLQGFGNERLPTAPRTPGKSQYLRSGLFASASSPTGVAETNSSLSHPQM
jgi:hypothetical protein